jgi:hypothetical protein
MWGLFDISQSLQISAEYVEFKREGIGGILVTTVPSIMRPFTEV